ncbi:MAG: aminopeptidase P family protein [Candidatus Micrarchaeota archaeon]|nr:aminopeptidase P family protein [Candidatus Micrarchaeota archaeon]
MYFDYKLRQKKMIHAAEEHGIGLLLVTGRKDIFYFTGFMVSAEDTAALLFDAERRKPVLFVSPLLNQAESLKTARVEFIKKLSEIGRFAKGVKSIGFDETTITVSAFNELRKAMKGVRLRSLSHAIKSQRMIKDENEIAALRKASRIAEGVINEIKNRLEGRKEIDIANEIKMIMLEKKSEPSFESIIASGRNSALIHYTPGRKIIKPDDMVLVDIGAVYEHYRSDMTRTFCAKPSGKEIALHRDILEIQSILIDNMKDGVSVKEISEIYQNEMKKRGYEVAHSWGHGIGLDVHEMIDDTLKKGMVVTVEPGAYIKGFGGCRIEDMIVIGKEKSRKLTKIGNEL